MQSFYKDVPRIGDVRVTDHAKERAREQNISTEMFERILLQPTQSDIPEGRKATLRERNGIRIVIVADQRDGPQVVKTVYRVNARTEGRHICRQRW